MWDHSSSLGGRKFSSDKQAAPHRCHPERSGPIFFCAPNYGVSGRAARFVRPVRFAGVEGSLLLLPSCRATPKRKLPMLSSPTCPLAM